VTFVNKKGFIDFLSMKSLFECEKKVTYVNKIMYFYGRSEQNCGNTGGIS